MSDMISPGPGLTEQPPADPSLNRFFWYELLTPDLDAGLEFYRRVIGWNTADSGMEGMRYEILRVGDRSTGGAMQLTEEMRAGGASPAWLGYIHVDDADRVADRVVAAGGRILMPPADIPTVGRFAMVADPGGAPFYLLAPFPQEGEMTPIGPEEDGAFAWHELYAGNGQAAAFDFYSGLFGWETMEELDMGPMGKYRLFGKNKVHFGGMMDKPADMPVSVWSFYVNVAGGIDAAVARVQANQGEILMGPHEVPGGSWIVQARDPQGAHFALVSLTR